MHPTALAALLLLAACTRASTESSPQASAEPPRPSAEPPRPSTAPPATDLPTLEPLLHDVASFRVTLNAGVTPPFSIARTAFDVTQPDDVRALVLAIDVTRPATEGIPRCLTAFAAELFDSSGARLGALDLYCAGGTATPVPLIRDANPDRAWSFGDPAAAQALLQRLAG